MTNQEANELITVFKRAKEINFVLDKINFHVKTIELEAEDERLKDISLLFDISASKKQSKRKTLQLRANKNIHLLRNDFYSVHTNPPFNENTAPDDETLRLLMQKYSEARLKLGAHLHVYIDGYDDKWAFPISEFKLSECDDNFLAQIEQFCTYGRIKIKIERALF